MEGDRPYDEYYEIDLREYIQVLWNGKWIIIGLFIISVLAAGIISRFVMTPVYETEVEFLAPTFTLLNGQQLDKQEYLSFMHKNEMKREVIDEFGLQQDNPDFSIENLDEALTLQAEENRNLVTVQLKNYDPELAKNILNFWVDSFRNDVITFIDKQNNGYLESLKEKMEADQQKYESALNKWTSFQKEVNLDLLTSQLEEKESRLVAVEKRISDLQIKTKKLAKEYETVTEQFSSTDKFIVLQEMISDSSLRKLNSIISGDLDNLTTEREELNSQYDRLNNKKSTLDQQLTSSQLELELLTEDESNLGAEVTNLQQKIADFKQQETLLKDRLQTTEKNYRSAEATYINAVHKLNEKNYQINILNSAITPENPVSPNVRLNIAIAGVLGLMIGVFVVFFREFLNEEDILESKTEKA